MAASSWTRMGPVVTSVGKPGLISEKAAKRKDRYVHHHTVCFHFCRPLPGLPQFLSSNESTCSAGDVRAGGSIPGSGRSPGGGHGNPPHYCLENPVDRGAWWGMVHRVTKSQTQLKQLSTQTPYLPSMKPKDTWQIGFLKNCKIRQEYSIKNSHVKKTNSQSYKSRSMNVV